MNIMSVALAPVAGELIHAASTPDALPVPHSFDAVITLSGGIIREGDGFATTTYAAEDGDPFGMLGGRMRIAAAAELHRRQVASTFVFTTGVTAKTVEMLGPDVPAEAAVYEEEFIDAIAGSNAPAPETVQENRSQNTIGNIIEVADIIAARGWKNVAVLSSDYHVPRIEALCGMASGYLGGTALTFLSAENVVRQASPGRYDAEIDAAYASPAGQERLRNEAAGVARIRSGEYVPTEFQLSAAKS